MNATQALEGNGEYSKKFYESKLHAMKYYYTYELPKALNNFDLVASLDDTCFSMSEEQFVGSWV